MFSLLYGRLNIHEWLYMSGIASDDMRGIFAQAECRLGWGKTGHPEVTIINPSPHICGQLEALLGTPPETEKENIGTAEQTVVRMSVHMFRQLGILPPSLVQDALYVMSAPEISDSVADRPQRKHAQDIMKEAAATLAHGLLPDIRHMEYGRAGFGDGYCLPSSCNNLSPQEKELSVEITAWTARQAGANISTSGIPPALEAVHIHHSGAKLKDVQGKISTMLAQRDVKTAPSHMVLKGGQSLTYLSFANNTNPKFLQWVTQELARNGMESFVHSSAKFGGDVVAIPMTNDNSAKHYRWSHGPSSPIARTLAEEEAWFKTLLPCVSSVSKQETTFYDTPPQDGLLVDNNVVKLQVSGVLRDVLKGNLARQGIALGSNLSDKCGTCKTQQHYKLDIGSVTVLDVAQFARLEKHLGTDVQRAKEQAQGAQQGFAGRESGRGKGEGSPFL